MMLVNELEANVRSIAQHPAELDIQERKRFPTPGVLKRASIYGIEADRPGQFEHRVASGFVIASCKGSQLVAIHNARAHVLREDGVEGLDA
jgi:hypothetical protein